MTRRIPFSKQELIEIGTSNLGLSEERLKDKSKEQIYDILMSKSKKFVIRVYHGYTPNYYEQRSGRRQ